MTARNGTSKWIGTAIAVAAVAVTIGSCALAQGRDRDQRIAKLEVRTEAIEPLAKAVVELRVAVERLNTQLGLQFPVP
ncbi:MAG: hypothetical protein JXQ73_25170 [Phycisphaerae bacterium]|nr:hypothetical protein [Phycisphaerae bacterium]